MVPKYIKLKETINQEILSGNYPIGSKLPTEVQLAAAYKVSRSTVRLALELLVTEGIIDKHWGSGNTVISKSDTSKKNTIMVLVPFSKNPTYSVIIEDLSSLLLKEGFTLEIHETKNKFSLEREILSSMLNDIYGGLVIAPALSAVPSTNTDLLQILLKRQLPIVFLGSAPDSIYNATVVSSDHYNRGYQMARSFINSGHDKLGGIFLHDNAGSVQAFSGFVDAIRDANLTICDECFFWINSVDAPGVITRTSGAINRFLKNAYEQVQVVYVDDETITTDGTYPLFKSNIKSHKSLGKEAAKALLRLKTFASL